MSTNHIELPMADARMVSLPALANLCSVLGSHCAGKNWILENYLNLVAFYMGADTYTTNDETSMWVDFLTADEFYIGRTWEYCWLIRKKVHTREFVEQRWESFSEFCIDAIRMNMYIFVTINTTLQLMPIATLSPKQ